MQTYRATRLAAWLTPLAAGAAIWALSADPCAAATYVFDQKHTEVRFACSIGLGTQRGRFTRVEGQVAYDPAAPEATRIAARVATASLTTGEPVMDDMLKGTDFFNVGRHPRMTFLSRSVQSTGKQAAVLEGDVSVNGVTRPVKLAVTIAPRKSQLTYGGDSLEFVARTRIKRSQFNMGAFASMASDDVDIEIDALLRKKP